MTYDETVAFLRTREGKFNRHDVNTLGADHTDDGVVRSPIFPQVQGVVNIQSSYRAFFTMFPDFRITFEPPIIDVREITSSPGNIAQSSSSRSRLIATVPRSNFSVVGYPARRPAKPAVRRMKAHSPSTSVWRTAPVTSASCCCRRSSSG